MPVNTVRPFELREAARFLVSGGFATIGNLLAVWCARMAMDFRPAMLCGMAAGMTISFVLAKFYAFRSQIPSRVSGEVARFAVVYGLGLVIYMLVTLATRSALVWLGVWQMPAELGGVLAGAASMAVSGYFGHRFFTYRTHRQGTLERFPPHPDRRDGA